MPSNSYNCDTVSSPIFLASYKQNGISKPFSLRLQLCLYSITWVLTKIVLKNFIKDNMKKRFFFEKGNIIRTRDPSNIVLTSFIDIILINVFDFECFSRLLSFQSKTICIWFPQLRNLISLSMCYWIRLTLFYILYDKLVKRAYQ